MYIYIYIDIKLQVCVLVYVLYCTAVRTLGFFVQPFAQPSAKRFAA